ncbi:MAG TPA: DUF99 family protein [Thermoplasmata archaeon]|nr:DUF99 family protein [Thermoplasmata archaeon]
MKAQTRFLGIDDAPFTFSDERTSVVGAVVRAPGYLEGVMHAEVTVDGTDALAVISRLVNRSRYKEGLELLLLDGIAVGGFNVIDIHALWKATDVPVVSVTRRPPDTAAMVRALKGRFTDWEARAAVVTREAPFAVKTAHRPLYANAAGITAAEAKEAIRLTTVRGALPEPIRMAHLIAAAYRRGESRGRA